MTIDVDEPTGADEPTHADDPTHADEPTGSFDDASWDPYQDSYEDDAADDPADGTESAPDDEWASQPLTAGPLTAEAVRLVTSLQDWVRRTAADVQQAPDGHTGPECQWCPLCQFVAVLRGERPEVTERVAEAGVAVASALRSLLDATSGAAQAGAHRAEQRADERADADSDIHGDTHGDTHSDTDGANATSNLNSSATSKFGRDREQSPRVQHIRLGDTFGSTGTGPGTGTG